MPKIRVWCSRYFLRRTARPHRCGPVTLRPPRCRRFALFGKYLIYKNVLFNFKNKQPRRKQRGIKQVASIPHNAASCGELTRT